MHIPDGFINAGTSLGGGVTAAAGLAYTARKAGRTLEDKQIPMAGLTAAFIFAMQMINVPVAHGTSGHLLGGVMAAILVGPWAATLCAAVVLLAQTLFFADGGVTALGLNLTDMALIAPLVGYLVFLAVRRVLPRTKESVSVAAAVAGFVGMLSAVIGFVVFYAVGGTSDVPIRTVASAMIGVHTVIAVLEGLLTSLIVGAVVAVRPDLVHGARDLVPTGVAQTAPVAGEV